jgi:hypothetical protein
VYRRIQPTRKPIRMTGINVERIAGGEIEKVWQELGARAHAATRRLTSGEIRHPLLRLIGQLHRLGSARQGQVRR